MAFCITIWPQFWQVARTPVSVAAIEGRLVAADRGELRHVRRRSTDGFGRYPLSDRFARQNGRAGRFEPQWHQQSQDSHHQQRPG